MITAAPAFSHWADGIDQYKGHRQRFPMSLLRGLLVLTLLTLARCGGLNSTAFHKEFRRHWGRVLAGAVVVDFKPN